MQGGDIKASGITGTVLGEGNSMGCTKNPERGESPQLEAGQDTHKYEERQCAGMSAISERDSSTRTI